MRPGPRALVAIALSALAGAAAAQDLQSIEVSTAHGTITVDLDALEAMRQAEIETSTPWTVGVQLFRGATGAQLLAKAPAGVKWAVVRAHNDYVATIPVEDLRDGAAIFATRRNGARMSLRDKGPVWVVYDLDELSHEDRILIEPRMVWQVRSVEFR